MSITPDHDVLTVGGWKKIVDISFNDQIVTLNKETDNMEWYYPDALTKTKSDKMYKIYNKYIDLVVTTDYKLYTRTKNSEYGLTPAADIMGKKSWYKKSGINANPELLVFELPGFSLKAKYGNQLYFSLKIDMEAWLTLFGLFLSHGSFNKYDSSSILISESANKTEQLSKLMHILRFNGFYNEEEDYFRINNTQLTSYLRSIGNELPDWIINLSMVQSKLLLDSLLLSGTYTTAVKKNADIVQILAINAGETVDLSLASNIYTITGSKSEPLVSPSDESVISYNGSVYGLSVPNNIFMVRRGGKYCWIGSA
jgi:hypothetical protein